MTEIAHGRRSEIVPVPPGYGRDSSPTKHFLITEWPALRAEKWAWRVAICLKGTTAQIPEGVERLGMIGVARYIINGFLRADIDEARFIPLLDELLDCVKMVRDPTARDATTGLPIATPLVSDDDIEEVRTVAWLRSEVLRIHTGFSVAEAISLLLSAAATGGEDSSSIT